MFMALLIMISERAKKIPLPPTIAINTLAKEMLSKGVDLVEFTVGEPDFPPGENVKKAAIKAINEDLGKYTAAQGIPKLRQAIITKFKRDNNLKYNDDQITVGNGGKQCIDNAFRALLNKGDEVIIPIPYWVSYPELVKLSDGVPIVCKCSLLEVSAKCIESYITKKTKVIVLNYPCNPSGMTINKKELEKIAKIVVENDLYVISDEVYEQLLYDDKHISIASLNKEIKKRTIVINSVSKTYAMTGWRLGYAAGPSDVIKAMIKMQAQCASNPNTISQYAAIEALTGPQDYVAEMRSEYKKRRNYMIERLNKMKNIHCDEPHGAFYAFFNILKTGLKADEFCEKLLKKAKVTSVPGTGFGMDDHVRLSYATSMEEIEKGMDRLEKFLEKL